MYKLMIVDDEVSVRFGLRDCIAWADYGIEVCATAEDGSEALDLIGVHRPDIVITDVKMPGLDGIALATRLREDGQPVQLVFISGFGEVDYLRSALQVAAVDYILKPINLTEFKAVIEKVVNRMREERDRSDLLRQMNAKLLQSMPLLRERFLISLIRGALTSSASIHSTVALLDIPFLLKGHLVAAVLRIDDYWLVHERQPARDKQLIAFAITNICQELIDRYLQGYVFEHTAEEFVCVLNLRSDEGMEKLFTLVGEIKANLLRLLKVSVTIGVGKKVNEPAELPSSYAMAVEASSQKLYLGKNQIITIDSLESDTRHHHKSSLINADAFTSILKAANSAQLIEWLDRLFDELTQRRTDNLKQLHNICLQLVLIGSNLLIELDINSQAGGMDIDLNEQLFKLETVADMKVWLEAHCLQLCGMISEKRTHKESRTIEQVKEIIAGEYGTSVTIEEIANRVFLTSTYVCLLFKQETGETINEYLTKVRIDKAIELLKDNRNKLYDICYAVGYQDPSYFTKLFKKHTGLTPSEYRGKLL